MSHQSLFTPISVFAYEGEKDFDPLLLFMCSITAEKKNLCAWETKALGNLL